jgi:hypothetical protein
MRSSPFERSLNSEMTKVRRAYDYYPVLSKEPVDDEGNPYPKRITGYDVMPIDEHDTLSGMEIAKAWMITPDQVVNDLPASEYLRRLAIVKAASWSQPTAAQAAKTRNDRRMRRR